MTKVIHYQNGRGRTKALCNATGTIVCRADRAGLCDEILRLRDGLAGIAESADGMQYEPHEYAQMILDGTPTECLRCGGDEYLQGPSGCTMCGGGAQP